MTVTAFFFDADKTPTVGGSYGTLPESMLFTRILEMDHAAEGRFRMWSGDLMLNRLAYRAVKAEVTATAGKVRGTSVELKPDMDFYRLILWDFIDSLSYGWTSIDLHDLTETIKLFGQHNIYVLVLSHIPREWVVECDRTFESNSWYIGAAEMDLSNPSHQQAVALPHRLSYVGRRLGLVGEVYDEDSRHEVMNSQGEWPSKLPFRSVEPIGYQDSEWSFPEVERPPMSGRTQLTAQRMGARARPTHFDKVARALQNPAACKKRVPPVSVSVAWTGKDPVVDRRKLVDYCLTEDPTRREGFAKARVFRSALGITSGDWQFLAAQLVTGLATASPREVQSSPYGVQYEVLLLVQGRNGIVVPVVTAWLITGDDPPWLTTAYVAEFGTAVAGDMAVDARVLPFGSQKNWQKLHELAHQAGKEAAAATVPTPMFLTGERPTDDGACGVAWVVIPDARRSFPKWLISNGYAHRQYPSGACLWADSHGSQSVERNRAYTEAYASVLRNNGIDCVAESRLD